MQSACAEIDKDDAPFVVSAAVGFLCSLSYRPASRAAMLEQQVVPSLVPVIRKDSTEHNSMSAVLVAANVAGHLPQERCPAPKDLQLCAKAVAALQATLMRATFGGRYGTLWKVMMSVAALSDGAHNLPQLAANGVPGLVQQQVSAASVAYPPQLTVSLFLLPALSFRFERSAPGIFPFSVSQEHPH